MYTNTWDDINSCMTGDVIENVCFAFHGYNISSDSSAYPLGKVIIQSQAFEYIASQIDLRLYCMQYNPIHW